MSADLILTITDRSRGGDFSAWFREQGATLVLTALGRGTATTEVLDCLGLEATEKAVLLHWRQPVRQERLRIHCLL